MHPELVSLPGGFSIKTYGFFLMLGFLSAVWLAMRRAQRAGANPDVTLDVAFLCLLFGIGGARAFYVIHYWKTQFADAKNQLLAIIDITNGGLEFLGGFLGALLVICVYCLWKKVSLRQYLDIMAPSAMWGLAFGRIGCFFNGCCFGGLAAMTPGQPPAPPWAVQFPFASPAQHRHWQDREVAVPAELIVTSPEALLPTLIPEAQLSSSVEKRSAALRRWQAAQEAYAQAKVSKVDEKELAALERAAASAGKLAESVGEQFGILARAQQIPSRNNPQRRTSVTELQDLAALAPAAPVHPTQLYASGQALLLSLLLSAIFWYRRRHGVVIGALLLLYPVQRILEELIRADNPHDVAGMTISQSVSVGLLLTAAAYLFILYRYLPERSPRACSGGLEAA